LAAGVAHQRGARDGVGGPGAVEWDVGEGVTAPHTADLELPHIDGRDGGAPPADP